MASVSEEIIIRVPPARVWDVLGDFADGPARMAPGAVTDSYLASPDVRVVSFARGAVLREKLISLDHDAKRLVFSVVGDTSTPEHDNASLQVFAHGDGHSKVTWTRDVLPAELAIEWAPAMAHGLQLFKETLE